MLEIVADGLESNAEQQFHHLLLPVASGDEVLNSFSLRIAALANQFLHEGYEGIELLIGYWRVVANGGYNFSRCVQSSFRDRGMCRWQ